MTSNADAPEISSYDSHKKNEINFMGNLYKKTSLNLHKLSDDQASDLDKNEALQKFHDTTKGLLNTTTLATQRKGLPANLDFYQNELTKTNPAIFGFLTEEQQTRLKNKLLFTYYLILAQYQLNEAEGRNYKHKDHQKDLKVCADYINRLELAPNGNNEISPQNQLEAEINGFTKCMSYLGLTILAAWIVERFDEFMANKTGTLIRWLREINSKRLYWVWGGGMLASALALMPDGFLNTHNAGSAIAAPSPVTGYMSFVLYYIRLGINLFLLAKHTLGPWISQSEESKIPMWERFTTQWDQRKSVILNDAFWGPDNMVNFFWLTGQGFLGYAGNISTMLLLTFDLFSAIWQHWEEQTKHLKALKAMEDAEDALIQQMAAHESAKSDFIKEDNLALWQKQQNDLKAQKDQVAKMIAKAKLDWKYKDLNLFNDCCYAFALLLAFCVVIAFFCPPFAIAGLTASIISLIGAVLCFLISTIYTARGCYLEQSKTFEQIEATQKECETFIQAFNDETDTKLKKQLYLEIKSLMAETEYQKKVADFQRIQGFRSVAIDALFPLVTFASLVFIPFGVGFAVIAVAIAISIISNGIINQYKPEGAQLPDFDELEFKALKHRNDLTLSHFETKNGFFRAAPLPDNYKLSSDEESEMSVEGCGLVTT